MYDIIIVGGGPAGLTAAIYGRRNLKTVLVIEKSVFGGQIVNSPKVENIPGFESISGDEFGDKLLEQAMGQGAEVAMEKVGISCSRSTIPFDPRKPMDPSGVRLGTAAITTRGFDEEDTREVTRIIDRCIKAKDDDAALAKIRQEIVELCKKHPLYK